MEDAVFLLLRLGLSLGQPKKEELDVVSGLNQEDWERLQLFFDEQGVSGIAYDGLKKLLDTFEQKCVASNVDVNWWKTFILKWIGSVAMIESSNVQQYEVTECLAKKWHEEGLAVMVMKGLANAVMYPKWNHRNPGDVDCYLFGNYTKGNVIAKELGLHVDESWYKHSEIDCCGVIFENHKYFVHTREGKRSKQLEKDLEGGLMLDSSNFAFLTPSTVRPPAQWNAMFLTYHACSHFLIEGLRLKQVLDWVMFLESYQNSVDWKEFYAYCDRYHLKRFAIVLTAIAKERFGVNISNNDILTRSPYVDRVINSILQDKDFVYGNSNKGLSEKQHLIRNLFRYRWKYDEIYEESIWEQLWYYISGYLFKTDKLIA